jgi:hypothetical protein
MYAPFGRAFKFHAKVWRNEIAASLFLNSQEIRPVPLIGVSNEEIRALERFGVRIAVWFRCSLNKQTASGNRLRLILNREVS